MPNSPGSPEARARIRPSPRVINSAGVTLASRRRRRRRPQMARRPSRLPVCFVSGARIEGSFYPTPDGPVLAANYPKYTRDHPAR